MLTTYTTDGSRTRFPFSWPYLDRSHIMATRNGAPAIFKFVGDYELEVTTLFAEPLPAGETLKIFRATPDLVGFADFTDGAKLTATDLNRARLQLLFLIQERSGGLGGSVSQAVSNLTNEIETISGALDSLDYSLALLMNGLQTLDELAAKLVVVDNEAEALRDLINQTIADFDETTGTLAQRVDGLVVTQMQNQASVSSQLAVLVSGEQAMAARIDTIQASTTGAADEQLAASFITATIAQAKADLAYVRRVETLEAKSGTVGPGGEAAALVQQERLARVDADGALAQQITTLQSTIQGNLAQVQQDIQTQITTVNGKVTNLNAQYVLKVGVTRPDGKQITAGIGLAATSNGTVQQSEIVLMADRLVFVDSSTDPNAPLKPMFVAGNVDGSPTFIVPSNRLGDKQYPGRILVDGAVEARHVKANEFTGDKMKVGSITTRELAVNMGVNLLANSTFLTTDAWNSWDGLGGHGFHRDFPNADWYPTGGHALCIYAEPGGSAANASSFWYSNTFPVKAGQRYEFSAYAAAHRCSAYLVLVFFDAGTNYLGEVGATELAQDIGGGRALSGYKRLYGFGAAPAGATQARLDLRKHRTLSGPNSYAWFTQPMVADALPNQSLPSPYGPSGLGTYVTPAGIVTPSLSALSPDLGLVVHGKMVSADGQMTVDMDSKYLQITRNGRAFHADTGGMWFGPTGYWDPKLFYSTDTDTLTIKGTFTADAINAVNTLNIAGNAVTTLVTAQSGTVWVPPTTAAPANYMTVLAVSVFAPSAATGILVAFEASGFYSSGGDGEWANGVGMELRNTTTGRRLATIQFPFGTLIDMSPAPGWNTYVIRAGSNSGGNVGGALGILVARR